MGLATQPDKGGQLGYSACPVSEGERSLHCTVLYSTDMHCIELNYAALPLRACGECWAIGEDVHSEKWSGRTAKGDTTPTALQTTVHSVWWEVWGGQFTV